MNERRKRILQVSTQLFFEQGLHVPTALIAQKSSVSVGSLFNYFTNKQGLIDTLYRSIQLDIAEIIEDGKHHQTAADAVFNIWQTYITWALAYYSKHKVACMLKAAAELSDKVSKEDSMLKKTLTARLANSEKYTGGAIEHQLYFLTDYAYQHQLKGVGLEQFMQDSFQLIRLSIK